MLMDLNIREQLEHLLKREAECVEALALTLVQEYETLKRHDADNLDKVVGLKEQQLNEMNTLAAERAALLQQAGFSADKSGFTTALEADTTGTLRSLWQNVEEGLEKCQQQNQLNGKLLDVSKQQTQELLSLLLGKESSGSGLYDQRGNTSTSYNRSTSIKV